MRDGPARRGEPRRRRVHDKDGWLGAPALAAARRARRAHAPRLAVGSARAAARARGARRPPGTRRRVPPRRLPEGVHGRHARLADRADARRLGRRDHERRGARRDRPRGRAAGWPVAVHAIGDRANREALDAFERRGSLGAARAAAADRACAVPRARGHPPLRRARRRVLRPVQPRPVGPRPRRALLARRVDGAYAFRSLSSPARSSRTAPTRRSRSSTRWPGSAPASCGRSTSGPPGAPSRPDARAGARATTNPAVALGRRAAARPAAARLPRRPRRARPRPARVPAGRAREVEVVATMVGGRWVHNPPPWD